MPGTPPLPTPQALHAVHSSASTTFPRALASRSAFFYPSRVAFVGGSSGGGPAFKPAVGGGGGGASLNGAASDDVRWVIRCVPALLDKAKDAAAKAKAKAEGKLDDAAPQKNEGAKVANTGKEQNQEDVFAPPYQEDLLVKELDDFTVLLNKFCVVPRHLLLVTKEFQPQTMPPSPRMLALAYRLLLSHSIFQGRNPAKELLCFYNAGQRSGASQPHRHMQFMEVGAEREGMEEDGQSVDQAASGPKVPIEKLLERIAKDGQETRHIHALPLPYQHFVVLLSDAPSLEGQSSGPEPEATEELERYMGNKFMGLLDAMFKARAAATLCEPPIVDANDDASTMTRAESEEHDRDVREALKAPPSWNLLLTTRAMHLIPRCASDFEGLREREGNQGRIEDGHVEEVGSLSINSLAFAGHLVTRSDAELQALARFPGGVPAILRRLGFPGVSDLTVANGMP